MRGQITLDFGRAQDGLDLQGFGKRFVFDKAQLRGELHGQAVTHFAAQKSLVAVQGGDDLLGILPTQRFAIDRGIAHVGRRLHLSNGDGDAIQIGIADFVAVQHLGDGMAQGFAHPKLALGRPAPVIAAAAMGTA